MPVFVALMCLSRQVTVFAAVSLKESFNQISREFERSHPGVSVEVSYGGSQNLAAQIRFGAPVDVFASAGIEPVNTLHLPKSIVLPFTHNRLVIVQPARAAARLTLQGLARPMKLVIADRRVPAGTYALETLQRAAIAYGAPWLSKVMGNIVSYEQDVRLVLQKVRLGEADAGIVYATDAAHAGKAVRTTEIPARFRQDATYYLIDLPSAPHPTLASDFDHLVFSAYGIRVLKLHGFAPIARR